MMRTILASAPVRIDLAGGWTDIPELCTQKPGHVLSVAIRPGVDVVLLDKGAGRSTTININGQRYHLCSLQELEQWDQRLLAETLLYSYQRGVPLFEREMQILIHQNHPPSTGLGSSASLVVAMLCTLLQTRTVTQWSSYEWLVQLAEGAHQIHRAAGIIGGKQDEYAAVFGGVLLMEFMGERVYILNRACEFPTNNLVLTYVGRRSAASGDIIDRVLQDGKDELIKLLDPMRSLPLAMWDSISQRDHDAIGKLMQNNWDLQKKIPGVDDPRFEKVLQIAGDRCKGAKACGAGGGGCLALWTDDAEGLKHTLRDHSVEVLDYELSTDGLECSIIWQ